MSHQPERREKICLNCGTQLYGRFCHVCGQENIVSKQGFWSLVKHFIFDIFHFDGKFFDTLKHLFFRPGSISREYIEGKRTRYLEPVRMYLFTSAVFFLVFFALKGSSVNIHESFISKSERMGIASDLEHQMKQKPADSVLKKDVDILLDPANDIQLDSTFKNAPRDSVILYRGMKYKLIVFKNGINSKIVSLHGPQNWLTRKIGARLNRYNEQYADDPSEWISRTAEGFLHKMPYLLFVSLPVFAAILMLLYLKRKDMYYSDHAVFTLHHYIISFILMIFVFLFNFLKEKTGWGIFSILSAILFIAWPVYLFLEMKVFYGQGVAKTILKLLILSFLMILVLLILFTLFLLLSFFQN